MNLLHEYEGMDRKIRISALINGKIVGSEKGVLYIEDGSVTGNVLFLPNDRVENRILYINNGSVSEGDLIKLNFNEVFEKDTKNISIGSYCSQCIELSMYRSENIEITNNTSIEVSLIINDSVVTKLGTFFVQSWKDTLKTTTVKAYDKMTYATDKYRSNINYPNTIENVVKDIASQCGITVSSSFTFPSIQIEGWYEDIQCNQYIGYMAGLMGKNAYIDRNGELNFKWYTTTTKKIQRGNIFMNGYTKTNDVCNIDSLTCTVDKDNQLVSGSGNGLIFENPFMTQARLDAIYSVIGGLSFVPSTLKYRGNPSIELGDIVSVETDTGTYVNMLVSQCVTNVKGGMSATITSAGNTSTVFNSSTSNIKSPTELKIQKLQSAYQEAIRQIGDTLFNTKGGHYFVDVEEDGTASGWSIMDTNGVNDRTKMWKFTMGGLAFYDFSKGNMPQNFAMDMNGNIVANSITTGQLVGDCWELDLNGEVKIGVRGSNGEFESYAIHYDPKTNDLYLGINEITTVNGHTFNSDGITVDNSNTRYGTQITDHSFDIYSNGETEMHVDENGTVQKNATVKTYLIVGSYARWEDFEDDEDGSMNACFYVGG